MKKIYCGAVIALIGVIYSVALMVLSTINDVTSNGISGLWGLLQGYDVVLPFIISLGIVVVGIVICIWGMCEKDK